MTISATDAHPRQRARILETDISYVDAGRGDPIVSCAEIRPRPICGATLFPTPRTAGVALRLLLWAWGSPESRRLTPTASWTTYAISMNGSMLWT